MTSWRNWAGTSRSKPASRKPQRSATKAWNWAANSPRDPQELSSLLSRYGLRLISGWYSGFLADRSPEAEWEAAAGHLRLLEGCGCDVLVYAECSRIPQTAPWDQPLSQSPALSSVVDLPAYAERLGAFATRLNRRGMKLAYHYHLKMLVETGEGIAAFFEAAPPQVGLLLDTGHAYAAGADYGELLRPAHGRGGQESRRLHDGGVQ
jgi:inosose dehydratase